MVSARDDNHARCDWIPAYHAHGVTSGMTVRDDPASFCELRRGRLVIEGIT